MLSINIIFRNLNMNSKDTKFTSNQVLKMVGIPPQTLQNWLTLGVVDLESGHTHPGRGKVREYGAYEVARILCMKRLADMGVPLKPAFKITAGLLGLWKAAPGTHEGFADEPGLRSWLLVVPAAVWPTTWRRGVIRADDYVGVWVVDKGNPGDRFGLSAALDAIKDDNASVVLNLGKFLKETFSRLDDAIGNSNP